MSAVKSTPENALSEMTALISAFTANDDTRRQLDANMNIICTKYKHPFGTVTKTRNGARTGGGYGAGGMRFDTYKTIEYQACRFCGASIELKL